MTDTEADVARYTWADLSRVAEAAFVDGLQTGMLYCDSGHQTEQQRADEVEQFRKRFALKETT